MTLGKTMNRLLATMVMLGGLAVSPQYAVAQAHAGDERVMKEFARRTGIKDYTKRKILDGCDGAQMAMNFCAEYHFVERDLQLNDEYHKLQKNLDGRDLNKLIAAQRAWVRFRDLNCEFATSDVEGGSMRGMVSSKCKQELTEDRTTQLREYIACTSIHGECPPRAKP